MLNSLSVVPAFAYGHPLVTGHENSYSSYGTPLGDRSCTNLHGWYSITEFFMEGLLPSMKQNLSALLLLVHDSSTIAILLRYSVNWKCNPVYILSASFLRQNNAAVHSPCELMAAHVLSLSPAHKLSGHSFFHSTRLFILHIIFNQGRTANATLI